MSKSALLLFILGVCVSIYGIYAAIADGFSAGLVFIAGGIVLTAVAAGIVGKAHAKDKSDAR